MLVSSKRSVSMSHHAAVVLLVLTSKYFSVQSTEAIDIATIERYNGETLGPYIVRDFHSDATDEPPAIAQPLTGEEEGSGDYSDSLDIDTEEGDDTEPGLFTVGERPNDLQPKEVTVEILREPVRVPSAEAVDEFVFVNESMTAQSSSMLPSPSTTQPSKTTTPAPQRPSPSPLPSSFSSSSSTASPECHESCVSLLEAVTLEMLPVEVSLVREGEGMRLVCSVSTAEGGQEELLETIQFNWLFQPETPPSSECSLDGQEYLAECEGFTNVLNELQRNRTHLRADILFPHLAVGNTGRYMCQVTAYCCGSLPQHQLQHSVRVWQADYTTELLLMSLATVVLMTVLGLYFVCKKRRAEQRTKDYMAVLVESAEQPVTGGKVLHLPLQQDEDYDDRDSFSSTDSVNEP